MTKKPMTLYAQADEVDGQLEWSIGETPPTKKGQKKTITFPKNSGEYSVTVQLIDKTQRGIVFNPASPLYVQEGGTCPPAAGINTTEIPASSVVPTPASLTFTNRNMKDCSLIYQLNFVDSKNRDVVPALDPEFKNGGGGGRKLTTAAAVTVAAIGVLLIYLVLTSMGKLGR